MKKAVEIFRELDDFKDSRNYIDKCYHIIYKNAVLNSQEKDTEYCRNAYEMFDFLGDYLDSCERKEKLGLLLSKENKGTKKSPFKNFLSKFV